MVAGGGAPDHIERPTQEFGTVFPAVLVAIEPAQRVAVQPVVMLAGTVRSGNRRRRILRGNFHSDTRIVVPKSIRQRHGAVHSRVEFEEGDGPSFFVNHELDATNAVVAEGPDQALAIGAQVGRNRYRDAFDADAGAVEFVGAQHLLLEVRHDAAAGGGNMAVLAFTGGEFLQHQRRRIGFALQLGEKPVERLGCAQNDGFLLLDGRGGILALDHYREAHLARDSRPVFETGVFAPGSGRNAERRGQRVERTLVQAAKHRGRIGHHPCREGHQAFGGAGDAARLVLPDRKYVVGFFVPQVGLELVEETVMDGVLEHANVGDVARLRGRTMQFVCAKDDLKAGAAQGPDNRHRLPVVPEDEDAAAGWRGTIDNPGGLYHPIHFAPHNPPGHCLVPRETALSGTRRSCCAVPASSCCRTCTNPAPWSASF